MTQPLPTKSLGNLDEAQQNKEKEFYRRRLVHYHCMHGKVQEASLRSVDGILWHAPLPPLQSCAEGSANTSNEKLEDAHGERHAVSSRVRPNGLAEVESEEGTSDMDEERICNEFS